MFKFSLKLAVLAMVTSCVTIAGVVTFNWVHASIATTVDV